MNQTMKRALMLLIAAVLLLPAGWPISVTKADTSASDGTVTVYHEDFATGVGKAIQSGGATLTQVTGKTFAGNEDGGALYVSNRVNNWDAADFRFSDIGLTNGKTYTVNVTVYVDAAVSVPAGAKAALQTVDSYGNYAEADYLAGQAVTLTKEFTVDTGADKALRINSNAEGAAISYYIGDIRITEQAGSGGGEQPPRDPALPFSTITFEDQTPAGSRDEPVRKR